MATEKSASKDSKKLREPVWRPKRPQNASKNSKKSLKFIPIGIDQVVTRSVSFYRLRKVLVHANRTSYAKFTAKTVQHPRNQIAAAEDLCFLQPR